MINRLELVRYQISSLARLIDDATIKKAGQNLDQKCTDLEWNLMELRQTDHESDKTL
jgi:hypothetical protein